MSSGKFGRRDFSPAEALRRGGRRAAMGGGVLRNGPAAYRPRLRGTGRAAGRSARRKRGHGGLTAAATKNTTSHLRQRSGAQTGGLSAAATGNRMQGAAGPRARECIHDLRPFVPFVVVLPPRLRSLPASAEIGEICGRIRVLPARPPPAPPAFRQGIRPSECTGAWHHAASNPRWSSRSATTRIREPALNSPDSSRVARGLSRCSWMARFRGRAPYCGS